MKEYINLIRRKSQLIYDINSIKRYIDHMEYDHNLKKAWEHYNKELETLNEQIESITGPQLKELEEKKTDILGKIKIHEEELYKLNSQLKDIDAAINNLKA